MPITALTPPAHSNELQVNLPEPHVLLLTFNRPKKLNAMTPRMTEDLTVVLDWFEAEPELWYVSIQFIVLNFLVLFFVISRVSIVLVFFRIGGE